MTSVRVTLLTKPGCHLCDAARAAVAEGISSTGVDVSLEEFNILDDAELNARYWDEIPVVLVNGKVHTIWRVDQMRFEEKLREVSK